jgi:hypothetical protein
MRKHLTLIGGTALFALTAIISMFLGASPEEALMYAVVAPAFNTALYDPVKLSKIVLEIEDAWSNSQIMNELSAMDIETFRIMMERSNAAKAVLTNPVEDPQKDYDVEVMWPDFCEWDAVDCAQDICANLTGAQKGFDTKPYTITQCIEDSFEVSQTQLAKTSLSEEAYIAMMSRRVIKNILERLNQKFIVFLTANIGYNVGGDTPGAEHTYNALTGYTEVAAEDWNPDLMIDLRLDAQLSRIAAPFIMDGRSLYKQRMKAQLENNNDDSNERKLNLFDIESDPVGFAKAGIIDKTFVVSPAAYAFVTKNYVNNATPEWNQALGKYQFNLNLGAFGLKLDAYQQTVCEDSNTGRVKHVFLYRLRFDILPNPNGCDQDGEVVTGIIGYQKVA